MKRAHDHSRSYKWKHIIGTGVEDLVHCHCGGKYGRLYVDMVVESSLYILTQSRKCHNWLDLSIWDPKVHFLQQSDTYSNKATPLLRGKHKNELTLSILSGGLYRCTDCIFAYIHLLKEWENTILFHFFLFYIKQIHVVMYSVVQQMFHSRFALSRLLKIFLPLLSLWTWALGKER